MTSQKVKKDIPRTKCVMQGCRTIIFRRGLCRSCYYYAEKQKLLEEHAEPHQKPQIADADISVNKRARKGQCRLKVNSACCKKSSNKRDLCDQHYQLLDRRNLLDKYGSRSSHGQRLTINKKPKSGFCKMKVSGIPCTKLGDHGQSGFCKTHYMADYRRKKKKIKKEANKNVK